MLTMRASIAEPEVRKAVSVSVIIPSNYMPIESPRILIFSFVLPRSSRAREAFADVLYRTTGAEVVAVTSRFWQKGCSDLPVHALSSI